ncbi:MAG: hypothetical protein ACXWPM_02050 [Bdellovibrionota bacterium]
MASRLDRGRVVLLILIGSIVSSLAHGAAEPRPGDSDPCPGGRVEEPFQQQKIIDSLNATFVSDTEHFSGEDILDPATPIYKSALESAGFRSPEISTVRFETGKNDLILKYNLVSPVLVVFRDSGRIFDRGWRKSEVLSYFQRTRTLFSECGINIPEVTVIETEMPIHVDQVLRAGISEGEELTPVTPGRIRASASPRYLAKKIGLYNRPRAFFINSLADEEGAFSKFEGWGLPYIFRNDMFTSGDENEIRWDISSRMNGTAWIARSARKRSKSDHTLTHELGHVLGLPHQPDGIMSYNCRGNNPECHFRSDDCAKLLKSPFVRQ